MIDDRRVVALLGDVLAGYPTAAPAGSLAATLDRVGGTAQRRRLKLGKWRGVVVPSGVRLAVVGLATVLFAAVALVQFIPRPAVIGPTPIHPASPATASPSGPPTARPSATHGQTVLPPGAVPIESVGETIMTGVTYTSERFLPVITFQVRGRYDPTGSSHASGPSREWCPPTTSARVMEFRHAHTCSAALRYIRPYAFDCGAAGPHPDADALAAALLEVPADPTVPANRDLGSLQTPGAVPAELFAETYHGRSIQLYPRSAAVATKRCRIMSEPGSDDPVLDLNARFGILVLVDVRGELVVLLSDGGPEPVDAGGRHFLEVNHDLRFPAAES